MTFEQLYGGTKGAIHPILPLIFAGLAFGTWLHGRLRREVQQLTAETGTSLRPSRDRLAKGVAAYATFVGMTTVNLILLGVLPSGIT